MSTVSPCVPYHLNGITAGWLTNALRSTGVITQETRVIACVQHPVTAVTVSGEVREDGGGISGPQIVRLLLTYEGGTGPPQIIVKFGNWQDRCQMPVWPLKIRLVQVLGNLRLEEQFQREITFYQAIRSHIHGLLLPQVYYVAMSDIRPRPAWSYVLFDKRPPLRFCILMEDLSLHHFASGNPGESLSFARMAYALGNIAQLHAFGWNCPRLWDQLQLRPTPWLTFLRADEGPQRKQREKCVHTNVIPTLLKLWGPSRRPGPHAHGFARLHEPDMVAMLTAFNASLSTWRTQAACTARLAPQTIVHGDCHGWNHLFNPDDECRVIDFQFVGTGRVTDELAYFFMLSCDPEPEVEEHLLHIYHRALVAAGVHTYPYEQLVREYHVSVLTILLGNIVRAITFLKPSAYDTLRQDPKQADLLVVGDIARDRLLNRALHWYHTPSLRHTFFSVDALASDRST